MTTLQNETREIVVLTDAEIELIRIKREEQALALAKKEAEEQVRIQKEIAEAKARIEKNIAHGNKQVAAAQKYFAEFPSKDWRIEIKDITKTEQVYTYVSNGDNIIHWTQDFLVPHAKIVSVDGLYTVKVSEYLVYPSIWSRSATNKGFQMNLDGKGVEYPYSKKFLKRVSTVLTKVDEVRAAREYKIKSEQRSRTRDEVCLDLLTAQFPEATIVKETDSNYSYRNRAEFRSWVVYNVTLKNGIRFKATPSMDSKDEIGYSVSSVKGPQDMEGASFAEVLNEIVF